MMRPYMLWLARAYTIGGARPGMSLKTWRYALDDWISYQSETRRLCDAARLRVPCLRPGDTLLFDHKSKTIEILRPSTASLGVPHPARGAVQGGR